MPTRSKRQVDEVALQRREALLHQVREEIRFAAAGRNLSLTEVARRMGDSKGVAITGAKSFSLAKLADVGTAMGVTFRLVAIPDSDVEVHADGARPGGKAFTAEEVREMRRRIAAGERLITIAREFKAPPSTISDIHRGKTYRWVK